MWIPILLAILSGILLYLTVYPFSLIALAWLALVPLLIAIHNKKVWQVFLLGYLTGMIYYTALIIWITMYDYRIFVKVLLIISPYIGFFCVGVNLLNRLTKAAILKLLIPPAWWVSLMYLYSFTPLGGLGLNPGTFQPTNLLQLLSLTGENGITFLIIALNSTIAYGLINRARTRTAITFGLVLSSLVLTCFIYGQLIIPKKPQAKIPIAIIQPNFPGGDEWRFSHADTVFRVYHNLTMQAAKKGVEIIVWPQYTLPIDVYKHPTIIGDLALQAKAYIILGTYTPPDPPETGDLGRYNIGLIFSPKGKLLGRYTAIHPPPFRQIGQITGKEYTVFDTDIGKLGLMLCYDDTSAHLARAFVNKGAEMLFALANDEDFGKSKQLYLHASQDILRAIENRRYVVRAANTGISWVIDPYGRIVNRTKILNRQIILAKISPLSTKTFYTQYGDLLTPLCLLFTTALLVGWVIKKLFCGLSLLHADT